jgi:predicted RNase H-like HicB family nuclease
MNTEILFLVEESQEGGYIAKAIEHSIFTEADTLEELKIMIKDAVECHFEEKERPKLIHLHIVRNEVIVA